MIQEVSSAQEQTFGERVRALRTAVGMTGRDFARAVGISPQYLSDIERGRRSPPPVGSLAAWATALHVRASDLEEAALLERVDGAAIRRLLQQRDVLRREVVSLRRCCELFGLKLTWQSPGMVAPEVPVSAAVLAEPGGAG